MADSTIKLPFDPPKKLPGSEEYFEAKHDAMQHETDAKREERLGRHARAAQLRKLRDAAIVKAERLAP